MDAVEIAARHRQIARLLGAAGENEHVIIVHQPLDRDGHADFHVRAEDHALDLHLLDAPVDDRLVHLEVGNAVAEQAADPVGLLEHGRRMAHPRQLLRAGEAGRAGADDGDALAGAARRALRASSSLRDSRGRRSRTRSS